MARPGTFGKTVKELFQLNNLPEVKLPDDALSFEIFGAINGITTEEMPEVRTQAMEMEEDGTQSQQLDEDVQTTGRPSDLLPRPEEQSVREKIQLYTKESRKSSQIDDIRPTPSNSPERGDRHEEEMQDKNIHFRTSSED